MNEFGSLIEPPPVPFRFGAPGWYVLGALILLILSAAAWLIIRHYRRNAYRRQALGWLQQQETRLQQGGSPLAFVYNANMLLKRVAMGRYGRPGIAPLRNDQWVELLNKTAPRSLFTGEDAGLLQQALYTQQEIPLNEAAAFAAKSKNWIQYHRYNYAL